MVTMFHIFIVKGNVEERRYRDHERYRHLREKGTKRRIYGEGEKPKHTSERSKRQAGSGNDGTLVNANRFIWRG